MQSFGFKGFPQGSTTAIKVSQGQLEEDAIIPTWGERNGTLSIVTRSADTIFAPASVWFEVANQGGFGVDGPQGGEIYDPLYHEITYVWEFGETGSFLPALNGPPEWNDRNVAFGPKVAHTFLTAGTYDVRVWAVDQSGTAGFAETTVAVEDMELDNLYPTTQTIVFSNDGAEDWSEAPAGATQVATVSALQTALEDLYPTEGRVRFKRGQTVEGLTLEVRWRSPIEYWGTWGTGAKPVLRTPSNFMFDQSSDPTVRQFTLHGLDFSNTWDAATETGETGGGLFNFLSHSADIHYTIHDCDFSGVSGIWASTGGDASTMIISDCSFTNWRNLAIYSHVGSGAVDGALGIVGCSIAQHVDALNGGENSYGLSNDHGPIRIDSYKNVYIGACDLFSRNGWSPAFPDIADQPCLRLNTSATPEAYYNVERVSCEGGYIPIELKMSNTNQNEFPGNFLFDKMVVCATSKVIGPFFKIAYGGVTMRNTMFVMPNVPFYHEGVGAFDNVLEFDPRQPDATNADANINIYNCTYLNMMDTANDPGWSPAWESTASANFNNVTIENNVIHAPNVDTPVTAQGPIDVATTLGGFTARYKGVRYNFEPVIGTLSTDVANDASFAVPYSAITDDRWDTSTSNATDQAYWTALSENDHYVSIDGSGYRLSDGEVEISFDVSVVTITNRSGLTWSSGDEYILRLDRRTQIPAMQTSYASPATIPAGTPETGSSALQTANLGLRAFHDLKGALRVLPASQGSVEP